MVLNGIVLTLALDLSKLSVKLGKRTLMYPNKPCVAFPLSLVWNRGVQKIFFHVTLCLLVIRFVHLRFPTCMCFLFSSHARCEPRGLRFILQNALDTLLQTSLGEQHESAFTEHKTNRRMTCVRSRRISNASGNDMHARSPSEKQIAYV